MVDLSYPAIQTLIASQAKRHPTESRAFLAWMLESIYRLDDTHADDCVCDGPDDKGIDGIFVNESTTTIEVFQAKLYQNRERTIGDTALRDFAGTLTQFETAQRIEDIVKTTTNQELQKRILELKITELIAAGYQVVGVFLTNSQLDHNGRNFLKRHGNIRFYGPTEINQLYVSDDRNVPETGKFELDLSRYGFNEFVIPQGSKVLIAPVPATQLVKIPGIESGALFAPNLRQSLGRTKVNRDIEASVEDPNEHGQFFLYHNGITMVCESFNIDERARKIVVSNAFVVNGCQSLSTLYEKKDKITDDLSVLVKLVEVGTNSDLIGKITNRSNTQNVIKPRDFKSNDSFQNRIQNEFRKKFGGTVFYETKRGETEGAQTIIQNELAAKLLLSFDLGLPDTVHQNYRLFDDLYTNTFARPSVTAERIYCLYRIYLRVVDSLPKIENQPFANYGQTKFFLVHLVAQILKSSPEGSRFFNDPSVLIKEPQDYDVLDACMDRMLEDIITDLNGEIRDRAEPLDYKRELKSASAIQKLTNAVVGTYQKLVSRKRIGTFNEEWNEAKETIIEKTKKL